MSKLARRQFIQSLAAAAATPAILRAGRAAKRFPIAFSTLGCPNWNWKTILSQASQLGYAAIELRGILSEMDLTKVPEFTGDGLKASLRDLSALGLKIADLGSSAQLHEPDAAKRARHIDEAKRFIDLAYRLKASYVRVFPNQLLKNEDRRVTMERIIAGLRELGDYAKGSGVVVLVESHGEFNTAPMLLELMQGARRTTVAFLWDAHHTCVSGEKPEETYRQLGRYVRHTHLKDSVPNGKDRRYVLTGTGGIPVKETVSVLATNGYKGYYCFEWEKRWHPEIEEPEIAFPHYARVMREYLTEAGVKA
ncbi:MAG TPA: sugar phosphate isomerase/epimerase family protein [Blastocatellia bacterium]|nr:sugar phosphate isomerase/epimerase family protein [Blastocatellia bacterium]